MSDFRTGLRQTLLDHKNGNIDLNCAVRIIEDLINELKKEDLKNE
jgi:hypothetical protein